MKNPSFHLKFFTFLLLLFFYGFATAQNNHILNGGFSSTTCTGCTMTSSNVTNWLLNSGTPTITSTNEIILISGSDEIRQELATSSYMLDGHKYELELEVMTTSSFSGGIIVESDDATGMQQILNWPVSSSTLTPLKACFSINDDKHNIRIRAYSSSGSPFVLTIDDVSIRDIGIAVSSHETIPCSGETVSLMATSVDASLIGWTSSDPSSVISSSGKTLMVEPTTTTSYTLSTYTNTGCVTFNQITLNPYSGSSPNVTINSDIGSNVCFGQTALLKAQGTGILRAEWQQDATLTPISTMQAEAIPTNTTSSTTYSAVLFTSTCHIEKSINLIASTDTPPLASFSTSSPSGACTYQNGVNQDIVYLFYNASIPPSGASNSYIWDFGDPASGASNSSSQADEYHVYTTPGTQLSESFDATLLVLSSNGCKASHTRQVQFYTTPSSNFTVTNPCQSSLGATFAFEVDQSISGVNYSWDIGGNPAGTGTNMSSTLSTSFYQTISLEANNSGVCSTSFIMDVKDELPYATPSVNFPNGNTVCLNGTLLMNETSGYPANQYRWYIGGNLCSSSGDSYAVNSGLSCFSTSIAIINDVVGSAAVEVINSLGCPTSSSSSNFIVLQGPNSTISYAGGNNPICQNNGSVDISGQVDIPTQSYIWYLDQGSSAQIIPGQNDKILGGQTQTGYYHFETTLTRTGCSSTSSTYYVSAYDPMTIAAASLSPSTPGVNHHISVLSAGKNYPVVSTFEWYRNGVSIGMGTQNMLASLPGEYKLVCTTPLTCGIIESNTVTVSPICPGTSAMLPNAGTYTTPTVYQVSGSINLSGSLSISNATILVYSGASININPPGSGSSQTTFNNVNIIGCGDWEGIIVNGNPISPSRSNTVHGSLQMNNTFISDAAVAVYAHEGGILNIQNTNFENNEVHVGMDAYAFNNGNLVSSSNFNMPKSNGITHSLYGASYPFPPALFIDGNTQINLTGNTFHRKNNTVFSSTAPSASNGESSVYVEDCASVTLNMNTFNSESEYQVYAKNISSLMLHNNVLRGYLNDPTAQFVVNGMFLKEVGSLSSINYNTIQNYQRGLEFYNNSLGTATMEGNHFVDNKNGLIIATYEYPLGVSISANVYTQPINLDIICNLFSGNEFAIVGSGALKTQGSPGAFGKDAANKFINNIEWDAVWGIPGSFVPPTYHKNPSPGPFKTGTTSINIDGNSVGALTIGANNNNSSSNCYLSLKYEPIDPLLSLIPERLESEQIIVYPNPFRQQVTLSGLSGSNENVIVISDALGRQLMQLQATGKSRVINTFELVPGIYIIHVYDSNMNKIFTTNIVKN